jgi:hypothetical protein
MTALVAPDFQYMKPCAEAFQAGVEAMSPRSLARSAAAFLLVSASAGAAPAQEASEQQDTTPHVTVTPAQGQSAAQMDKDKTECQAIAKQSTGFDPAQPAPSAPPAAAQKPPVGGRARGAARGALAGGVRAEAEADDYDRVPEDVKDEYVENEAREGAAAGAVAGAAAQRRQRRQQAEQQKSAQEQQAAQAEAKAQSFDQAYASCMMGRGYDVK